MLLLRNKLLTGVFTDTEDILMILPHFFSFILGKTSLDILKTDIMVKLMALCQSSSLSVSKVPGGGPPTLFTSTSMSPSILLT